MTAGENRFAPLLNEKEVIELLENATKGTKRKPQCDMKIFHKGIKMADNNGSGTPDQVTWVNLQ